MTSFKKLVFFVPVFQLFFFSSCSHFGSRTPGSLDADEANSRSSSDLPSEWLQWSGDLLNQHFRQVKDSKLNLKTISKLKLKWTYSTKTSVFGIPTVKEGVVYFGDLGKNNFKGFKVGGQLYAVNAKTGQEIWSKPINQYLKSGETPNFGTSVRNVSRVSPAVAGDKLIIGTSINYMKYIWQTISGKLKQIPGASVMAIDRKDGHLLWKSEVDPHFSSRITMSPVVYKNRVYVGVSSEESQIPGIIGGLYHCCQFRGSLVALDLETGAVLWKTDMISDQAKRAGFNGAAVWGSSPPIDEKRNLIYIGTGNNYLATPEYRKCLLDAKNDKTAYQNCANRFDHPENYFDSIVALDLESGEIKWSFKSQIYDAWNVGCGSPVSLIPPRMPGACPKPAGMDSDFGQAPMLILNAKLSDGSTRDLVVAGNKQGMFYAFDADLSLKQAKQNQKVTPYWSTHVAGGGALGGHEWGSATNGKVIFTQSTNLEHHPILMTRGLSKGKTIRGGFWSAIDVASGEVLWQTPDPATRFPLKGEGMKHLLYGLNLGRGQFASPIGPLTLYNDLLFAGSLSGDLYALNAKTGEVVWNYHTHGSAVSAPAIVNDQLFWGVGYPLGHEDHRMLSFGL